MSYGIRAIAISCILAAISFAAPSQAGFSVAMPTGKTTMPPAGLLYFCARHEDDCEKRDQGPVIVEMTDTKRLELDTVQARINAAIKPSVDGSHLWEYSTDGTGDCNKYALTKRRELIALGWSREALLLTVVITDHGKGQGHLVLVVTTSDGDLVLDNLTPKVTEWSQLPYRWLQRQSPQRMTIWVSLE